ncbi:hypothetical protein PIB30_075468, partial [Stylosanthes scabra]|nr:hypothetical protein [Stylosanthes scabra]
GLVRTGKLRAQKERKQKKNTKKSASSESEWESESETDTEGYVLDESEEDSDSEETRSEELVQRDSRLEPNPAQEERRSKKRHESNDETEGFSGVKIIRLLKQSGDDVIEISSCSDDEQLPDHMEVLHPLVPKVEELQEDQPPPVLEQPSQTVVEPIYPTQEAIDVLSGSEDERQPLIPKTEEYHVYSPSARIITDVLMSMNRDETPSFDLGIDPPLPQRDEALSFDLGIDPHLLTTQDLSDIEELDELVKKAQDQFQTPQTKKSLENQKDLEEKVITWVTVPKGGNEFETIFKLAGDMFLEAMRYQF